MGIVKQCKKCGDMFEKTGQADKFCLECRDPSVTAQRFCKSCGIALPKKRGPKKYCKDCAVKAAERRAQNRSLKSAIGNSCDVRFINCVQCEKLYAVGKSYNRKIEVCGTDCLSKAYSKTAEESKAWVQYPFQFRLSRCVIAVRSRLKKLDSKPARVGVCCFCGSAKVLGEATRRSVDKGRRCFCDEECAANWRSIHYASPNHAPMEEKRKKSKPRKDAERTQKEARMAERLAKRQARPANKKTPGYAKCCVCSKTWWVDQHSTHIKYCSRKCMRSHPPNRRKRREIASNRRHIERSRGIGDKISIHVLMRKHGSRCVKCDTKCVVPEGYNHQNEGTIDHIMPLSKGGLHIWSNVQLLCRRCNTIKRDAVEPGTQLMLDLRFS